MPLQTKDLQLQEQMLPYPFNWYLQSLSKLADLSLPRNPCSSRANSKSLCVERKFEECAFCQAERKRYTLKEWEGKLASATVRKEDMNELVMNFLVTEVGPDPFKGNLAVHQQRVHQERVPNGEYLAFISSSVWHLATFLRVRATREKMTQHTWIWLDYKTWLA